jgi:predicted MFS family arabinose efflux permease
MPKAALMPTPNRIPAGSQSPVPGAGRFLSLLIVINLFNYIDRQVLAAVLPRMLLDGTMFPPGDPNAQTKAGWLGSAFMVSYMLFSPLFGWMDGHRYRRWIILGLGMSVWSVASGSSGFVTSYWILLLLRCLIGIGEGAYGPVASAMIADMYPPGRRGKAMALFNMAIPVGSALGFLVGAQVAGWFDNWRPAFLITFSGLILGAVCFFQKDPPRPPPDSAAIPGYFTVLMGLLKNRSFILCCLGMTAITFVLGGVAVWAPVYLFQREARFQVVEESFPKLTAAKPKGGGIPAEVAEKLRPLIDGQTRTFTELRQELATRLTPEEAVLHAEAIYSQMATKDSPKTETLTTIFGAIVVLGGLAATAFGTWLGEKLRLRIRGAYFWVIAGGAFAAVPFYIGFLYSSLGWAWPCLFFCVFGLFLHTGPAFTLLANVTRTDERATAFAINILIIHALGDVISPPLIGWISDQTNLQLPFLMMNGMIALGGVLWLSGVKYLDSDTARAIEPAPPGTARGPV